MRAISPILLGVSPASHVREERGRVFRHASFSIQPGSHAHIPSVQQQGQWDFYPSRLLLYYTTYSPMTPLGDESSSSIVVRFLPLFQRKEEEDDRHQWRIYTLWQSHHHHISQMMIPLATFFPVMHPPIIRPAEVWQTHVHQIFAQFDTRAPIDQERRDQFSVNS